MIHLPSPAAIPLVPLLLIVFPAQAEKTVFYDQLTGCEMWRITNDPEACYTHHYVEIPSIDPTGRWVAFHEHGKVWGVHVADLVTGRVTRVGDGKYPVWHPTKPLLFYGLHGVNVEPAVMQAEEPAWRAVVTVKGVDGIRSTSPDGLYGAFVKDNAIWRVRLEADAKPELVLRAPPGLGFFGHMRQNPTRPWIFIISKVKGQRWNGPCFVLRDDGSDMRQFDIRGEYIGHLCWAADGSGMLRANTLWPLFKPFPLTQDTPWLRLSRDGFWPNHIGACGRDARLVTTDRDNQTIYITDTWTRHSYRLCVASGFSVAYSKDGDPHPHGSPDGTKVQFDSCYDLRDHGLTTLVDHVDAEARTLSVASTERFPERGILLVGKWNAPEFVRYARKDKTCFLDCERGFRPATYNSQYAFDLSAGKPRGHSSGKIVTDYFGRFHTPGVRRGPQIYVAVVRDPQPPQAPRGELSEKGARLTWLPPRLHHEIEAYRVERSSESGRGFAPVAERVTHTAFTDASAKGPGPFFYRVVSIERCGLESVPSAEFAMGRTAQPPKGLSRIFIEAETCSIFGDSGPESSTCCYGRQHVVCKNTWITVQYRLRSDATCAMWLRIDTHGNPRSVALGACRAGVYEARVTLRATQGFAWQRIETAPGQRLLLKATAGDNGFELRAVDPFDLDRVCVTDDLEFVPPDEPSTILPAPQVQAAATSAHEVKLEWPALPQATLYEIRDERTAAPIAETPRNVFVLKEMPLNSGRTVRVRGLNRWGVAGDPSPAIVCRTKQVQVVRIETEAEVCALQAPMAQGEGEGASGGKFVHLPYRGTTVGALTLTFRTPAAGSFLIVGRTLGYWPGARSLEVAIDGGKPLYLSCVAHQWQWWPVAERPIPPECKPSWSSLSLAAGEHTLTIRGTEDGLLLDRLLITNDVAWRPATDESMSLELMKARPMTTPGTETLLLPNQLGRFSVILSNPQTRPLAFSIEIDRIPGGMTVAPAAASADVAPGGQRLVTLDVQAQDLSARGHVHVLAKAAGQAKRLVMPVRVLDRPIVLVQIEAESAVELPEAAKIVDCDECSGGRCVEYTEGSAVVELELPEERDYIIWVRQFAPQGGFGHFANDGQQGFRLIGDWEDKLGRWSWLTSPRVPRHRWHAGKLRLSIKRRGDLFRRLDQVVVTDDPGFEPTW